MTSLTELIAKGMPAPNHRPFPRAAVSTAVWSEAIEALARGELSLLGLWGEQARVHMALLDGMKEIGVISLDCPDSRYPSVGLAHPPALRLERAARDLFGLEPEGLPDTRPWLDHGTWDVSRPLAANPTAAIAKGYDFLPVEGDGCTRFLSGRCMQASSSPAISASPPMARRWCGWKSG
jgi:hypothetical protein